MATRIDHGPPGSFKSFSIVQRYAIEALLQGRTVISNVRGFNSIAKIAEQYPEYKFPETARLYHLDTRTDINRKIMACWFKWVPFRAMVLIDEAQRIYPNRSDFKLESLDKFKMPEGFFQVEELPEGRPEDVFTAFDMQRHYEWDLYLTTPNIKKIKTDIREVAEWAYRHRSLSGLLPFHNNTWYEHQHDPENTGKSIANRVGAPRKYKADPRVFTIYQSTATGEITDSKAGNTVFSDPAIRNKLLLIGFAIASILTLVFTQSDKLIFTRKITPLGEAVVTEIVQPVSLHNSSDSTQAVSVRTDNLLPVKATDTHDLKISIRWRVVAFITSQAVGHQDMVYIQDSTNRPRRISRDLCTIEYEQLSCKVDGEIVNLWSGVTTPTINSVRPVIPVSSSSPLLTAVGQDIVMN